MLKDIDKMVFSNEEELEYEFESHLLKQKLSEIIQQKYPGLYTSFKRWVANFKVYKSKNFTPPRERITSIQDSLIDSEEDKNAQENNEEELKFQELEKVHEVNFMAQYRNIIGFTLVIEEMINSK